MASFTQQYGIRLSKEYDEISTQEYYQMLKHLNGDTPLGYYIQIRSETDSKKIQEMSQNERDIRNEWQQFRMKHAPKISEKDKKKKTKEFHTLIKSMFGGDSRR